jgi:hypothetical protein
MFNNRKNVVGTEHSTIEEDKRVFPMSITIHLSEKKKFNFSDMILITYKICLLMTI